MKLFGSGRPESSAHSAPQPAGRLHVERLELPLVMGWCSGPDKLPGELHLTRQGQPLTAAVRRWPRADVAQALQQPGEGAYGFELTLPPEAWCWPDVADASLSLEGGGVKVALEGVGRLPDALGAWAERLRALAPGEAFEIEWRQWLRYVLHHGGPACLSEPWRAWAQALAAQRQLSAGLAQPGQPVPDFVAPQGLIEAFETTVIRGWAWVPGATDEQIELWLGGQCWPAPVIRTCRDDVQRALGAARLRLGFEIEVPGSVWQAGQDQGACELQVRVAQVPFALGSGATSLSLSPALLLEELARLQHEAARLERPSGPDEEPSLDRAEHQYRWLLALEHLAASGLEGRCPPGLRDFVRAQAERFGLLALLASADAEPGSVPSNVRNSNAPGALAEAVEAGAARPAAAPLHDQTTVTVWRLLHRFNAALGPGTVRAEQALALLNEFLPELGAAGEARQRFLMALVPYFCALRAYAGLRPHLAPARMRALGSATGAWELSLLLPEALATADYVWACKLAEALAADAPGWLNTECLAQAGDDLAQQWAGVPMQDPAALALVQALAALLAGLGRDPWGRAHDRQLIDLCVSLLVLHPALPAKLARELEQVAIRVYALVPDFWSALAQRWPQAPAWPVRLGDARQALLRWQQALGAPNSAPSSPPSAALLATLQGLARAENIDAAQFCRELILAQVPQLRPGDEAEASLAFAELGALADAEALRLAAHPQWPASLLSQAPELASRIRAVSGIAQQPHRQQGVQVLAALRGAVAGKWAGADLSGPELAACRWLSRAEDGFVGVYLLAWRWCLGRGCLAPAASALQLSELREHWMACEAASAGQGLRPAALLSAYTLLAREAALRPDEDLARLLAECRARLGAVADGLAPPAGPACQLASPGPGRNTLVVIYSCRQNLATRVAQIRQTWAAQLSRLGVPWLVAVGEGHDQMEADQVLGLAVSDAYEHLPAKSLALARWVLEHTDFDHLLKIDDDCYFAAEAFFAESPHLSQHYLGRSLLRHEGGTDRFWHRGKASSRNSALAIDKSPEPSLYADGGAGYCLSRWALYSLRAQLETTAGARLTRSAYMEDKLLGDLLARAGITVSSQGYETLVRRRMAPGAVPVNAHQNSFYPSRNSPTLVAHLDDAAQIPQIEALSQGGELRPPRLWPSYAPPVLGGQPSNQLELLSPPGRLAALAAAPVIVVAVARNELLLLPHFLAHYRQLGVRQFVLVDNLSDDGTREYLLAQDDVVLYSADTEYRHSHFGVAWQQAVLAAHALNKWVVLADIDEFLVYRGCEQRPIERWLAEHDAAGHDAVLTVMVDMYPQGDLAAADFRQQTPFEAAGFFDAKPVLPWRLGSGCFSNGTTYVSALRHRLMADSPPHLYNSRKVAVIRYRPWVRLSEGLHYLSNIRMAPEPAAFAHFKYHAGFKAKVLAEVARKQHFNGAEEYQKYLALLSEAGKPLWDAGCSVAWTGSASLLEAAARSLIVDDDHARY